jgi:hypothetical protein
VRYDHMNRAEGTNGEAAGKKRTVTTYKDTTEEGSTLSQRKTQGKKLKASSSCSTGENPALAASDDLKDVPARERVKKDNMRPRNNPFSAHGTKSDETLAGAPPVAAPVRTSPRKNSSKAPFSIPMTATATSSARAKSKRGEKEEEEALERQGWVFRVESGPHKNTVVELPLDRAEKNSNSRHSAGAKFTIGREEDESDYALPLDEAISAT